MIGEMTVESEVPTDILIVDLVMTRRTDMTHNTVEGIMVGWNRLVLHPSTLHSNIYRRIYKKGTRDVYLVTGQPGLYVPLHFPYSHDQCLIN